MAHVSRLSPVFVVALLALHAAPIGCGASTPDQPKGATHSALVGDDDDDDDNTGDDDDNTSSSGDDDDDDDSKSGDDDDDTPKFGETCTGQVASEVGPGGLTGPDSCQVAIRCGLLSKKEVFTTGPHDNPSCKCECRDDF